MKEPLNLELYSEDGRIIAVMFADIKTLNDEEYLRVAYEQTVATALNTQLEVLGRNGSGELVAYSSSKSLFDFPEDNLL